MPSKKTKKQKKTKAVKKAKKTKKAAKSTKRASRSDSGLRQSKTENFLENIRQNNTMIDYITALRVMNPAAEFMSETKREGAFVRLAHANEEFEAPILSKGKSVRRQKKKRS